MTVTECVRYTLTLDPDVALLGISFPNEQDEASAAAEKFEPLPPRRARGGHATSRHRRGRKRRLPLEPLNVRKVCTGRLGGWEIRDFGGSSPETPKLTNSLCEF